MKELNNMENNFDITKMYIDNKKKVGISNIFSIFTNRESNSKSNSNRNKNDNLGNYREDNIRPKKNMKIQQKKNFIYLVLSVVLFKN